MNLDNTYMVKIKGFVQYIEADCVDDAIAKAKNTFDARLYNLKGASVTQKACDKTTIHHPLRFGFHGGWVTVRPKEGDTIYAMLERAKADPFTEGRPIEEITSGDRG